MIKIENPSLRVTLAEIFLVEIDKEKMTMQRITSSLVATVLILISTATTLVSSFQIKTASLPADLPSIQDCRRSAYAGKPVNLASAVSFCNADQVRNPNYICIIAKSNDGMVLGTADLNTRVSII